jgi:hypothetical protein
VIHGRRRRRNTPATRFPRRGLTGLGQTWPSRHEINSGLVQEHGCSRAKPLVGSSLRIGVGSGLAVVLARRRGHLGATESKRGEERARCVHYPRAMLMPAVEVDERQRRAEIGGGADVVDVTPSAAIPEVPGSRSAAAGLEMLLDSGRSSSCGLRWLRWL